MNAQEMEDRIKQTYPNCEVAVVDQTGTSNHFEVRIAEPSFAELSRVRRHQSIMSVFAEELKTGEIHALSVKTLEL